MNQTSNSNSSLVADRSVFAILGVTCITLSLGIGCDNEKANSTARGTIPVAEKTTSHFRSSSYLLNAEDSQSTSLRHELSDVPARTSKPKRILAPVRTAQLTKQLSHPQRFQRGTEHELPKLKLDQNVLVTPQEALSIAIHYLESKQYQQFLLEFLPAHERVQLDELTKQFQQQPESVMGLQTLLQSVLQIAPVMNENQTQAVFHIPTLEGDSSKRKSIILNRIGKTWGSLQFQSTGSTTNKIRKDKSTKSSLKANRASVSVNKVKPSAAPLSDPLFNVFRLAPE